MGQTGLGASITAARRELTTSMGVMSGGPARYLVSRHHRCNRRREPTSSGGSTRVVAVPGATLRFCEALRYAHHGHWSTTLIRARMILLPTKSSVPIHQPLSKRTRLLGSLLATM
jgi:hypothetical protein